MFTPLPSGRFLRLLIATFLLSNSVGPWVLPIIAQTSPAAGTSITNKASGKFKPAGATPGTAPITLESNEVIVTVSEVAGIAVSNSGIQDDGEVNAGDQIFYDFTITNIGNAETLFFIPDGPAAVTNGTFNLGSAPIQIIGYDPDGTGAGAAVDLTANTITVPASGADTATLLGAVAAANNGVMPVDATLTIRVPITVNGIGLSHGDAVTVVMGDTTDSGSGTQNQADAADASNLNEVRTVDPTTGNAADDPVNGEREASNSQATTVTVPLGPLPAFGPAHPATACPLGQGLYANWTETVDNASGRGTFNPPGVNGATLPNFSWTTTGDHNVVAVDSFETFNGTNTLEPIYGEADTADNLNVGLPANAGGNGAVIDQTTTLTITFDQATPATGWALALIDLDVDQALIRATDAAGNPVPLATIHSWFVETFDANPTTSGVNVPTWDSDDAAFVGASVADGQYTNLIDTSLIDSEAGGGWLAPNVSLSSLTIQFENKINSTATYHAYVASCLAAMDYGDAPDSYGTDINNDGGEGVGPSHTIVSGLQLGTAPDAETDAVLPLDGSGDGAQDDGVTLATLTEGDTNYTIPAADITATNTTGTAVTLHAWVDFDGSGTFEADEYASQTIQSGNSSPDGALAWAGVSGLTGGTTTYARFRLTTDAGIDANMPGGAASDGEVEDYAVAIAVASNPNLILVKRITAVAGAVITTVVDGLGTEDNDAQWPAAYVQGAIDAGNVEPGDEIEYTIYFLSNGNVALAEVNICDLIPAHTTYVDNSGELVFGTNAATPWDNARSADEGEYFTPNTTVTNADVPGVGLCRADHDTTLDFSAAENTNGAIWVEIDKINTPIAAGQAGYIRFRVTVNETPVP